jgi:hypothetical protein
VVRSDGGAEVNDPRDTSCFTIVFDGDIRRFKENPFHMDGPFGKPRTIGFGDAFEERDKLQERVDELEFARRT